VILEFLMHGRMKSLLFANGTAQYRLYVTRKVMPMRRRLPPLNALRAFEAAARNENFSRAAIELDRQLLAST
jgi:hypothetical protein